jgi:ribosome-binding protein aMBF1 (putative translation factor)
MDNQDWTPVIIKRSSKKTVGGASGNRSIVQKVPDSVSQNATYQRKLDSDEIVKPRQLSAAGRQELTQKRVALGKNQVQLNQDCRFPVNTIREIEAGRLCPNPQQLGILNRVLRSSVKYE